MRLEGIKFIISLVMGILSLAGWSFLTYCFFRTDAYGTLVSMYKARKRLNRMRKK